MVEFFRRAQTIGREAVAVAGGWPDIVGAVLRFLRSMNIWFWAIVGVPTLIAGVYFFAIASDLYVSEVKFIVRGPAKPSVSTITAMLGSTAPGANEDTFAVHEFLMSRDAVRKLEHADDLRAVFSRPEGDLITRFPGMFFWRKDFEALYHTYSHFVSVELDGSTGVSTLTVKAYRPEDAQNVARELLAYSEQLVNELNDRSRRDTVGSFEREVTLDQQRLAEIQTQLTAYRLKEKMLDPKTAATGPLALLAQLQGQLASSQGQLAEAIKNSPNSPQIPLVKTRIASLEKLIADERAKITGDTNSVAATLTEYERLDLQRQLVERMLASAVASLESARLEAQRQQLYLETIAQPNLPDYPLYPRRLASFAAAVTTCLLGYGIAWILVAGIREHASA
jgi:capsular polysaccharide transport system permease protein